MILPSLFAGGYVAAVSLKESWEELHWIDES
jgi:hypothetical protein